MAKDRNKGEDDRAARLSAQLRANLKRRKAQARVRDDLSGLDPNRTETPLNRPKPVAKDDERNKT